MALIAVTDDELSDILGALSNYSASLTISEAHSQRLDDLHDRLEDAAKRQADAIANRPHPSIVDDESYRQAMDDIGRAQVEAEQFDGVGF